MKSWLSSPLAINYLLSRLKNGPPFQKKYEQVFNKISYKDFMFNNKLLYTSSQNEFNVNKIKNFEEIKLENSKDIIQNVIEWVKQYGDFNKDDIEKCLMPYKTSLLLNLSHFKGTWKCSHSNPIMKVHNSFSYTDDIKYEARLLELPMKVDDFKLVVVVPNEVGSLHSLFNKLACDGLDAAVACIQPLFTFSTVLEAPYIEFRSRGPVSLSENNCDKYDAVQMGNVRINEDGTDISILTCLSFKCNKPVISEAGESLGPRLPFYFAILYKDTAIFTGRFVEKMK